MQKSQLSLSLCTKALSIHKLAYRLDPLVRVSRRVERCHLLSEHPSHEYTQRYSPLGGSYHVLEIFLKREATLTGKATNTARSLRKTYCHTCAGAASNGTCVQQSHQDTLASLTSFSAISGTVTFLFKVLFTFPSWHLFAIGLEPICSFR